MYQQLKRASMALTLSSVCFLAFAQKTIQGTVKDANGDPMIGVTITDQNGKAGGITDLDGKFTIQNADPNAVLTFSYIGCKPKKVKVGSQKTWNIVLEDDNAALDEVVVVGYGTMRKRDVTGSIASVNSEKIAARGTTNLAESLQGSVPGVNITQSGSRAGAGFNIQVRGQASINKQAQPLYVIDGVVCDNMDFLNPDDIDRIDVLKDASSTAIYGSRASAGVIMITTKGSKGADKAQKATISYDGYYGIKKLARMPEFMDANEFMDYRFARYTTLDGKSYDGSSRKGVDAEGHPHYIIKNTDLNSAFLARKGATSYKDSKLYELMMDPSFDGYDWKKMVTRTAAQQNHFISAAGSTDKVNYRVGMGYQGEENVFKGNDYERFNFKGAMDAKLSKIFEAGISTNMSMSRTQDICTDGTYSPYVNAFYFNPFVSPTDADGNLIPNPGAKAAFGSDAQFTSTYNPLIDLNDGNYTNETKMYRLMGNFYLRANIIKGLKFTTTFSPNYSHKRQGIFYATGLNEGNDVGSTYYQKNKTNFGSVANTTRVDWTWDNQFDYNRTFGDHTVGAMALFSLYKSNTEYQYEEGKGIASDHTTFHNLGTASGDKTLSSSYTESSLESFAFRANYSYKGRYMATATLRTDGSSRFADGNRWGWFPSVAAAWRISDEAWMKQFNNWLDNAKLRLSYGVTGNNNVGDYVTIASATGPSYVTIDGKEVQGYHPNGLVNTELIWEKVKEFDVGLDLSFLKNRINVTADFYNRLSDGQIMSRSVPIETGEKTSTFNVGSVQNRGIELGLNFNIINKKDFSWSANVNFARNWNKIKELSNGKVDEVANNWFIGEPLNVLRDYTHTDVITDKGVTMHTMNGDKHYTLKEFYEKYGTKYKWYEGQMAVNDWNDDGKIDDNDKQIYGCTDPRWTGSFTTNVYFKGFDFSIMFYTKSGFWSRSYFHEKYMKYGDRGNAHMQLDYYIPKGAPIIDHATGEITTATETHYGKYPYPNNSDTSMGGYFGDKGSAKGEGFQYQKTSFTKVKNITLGYTLPKSVVNKAGIRNLRVYVNVLNPFCFTNYKGFDPEWASQNLQNGGPSSVTYQFGVNLKF